VRSRVYLPILTSAALLIACLAAPSSASADKERVTRARQTAPSSSASRSARQTRPPASRPPSGGGSVTVPRPPSSGQPAYRPGEPRGTYGGGYYYSRYHRPYWGFNVGYWGGLYWPYYPWPYYPGGYWVGSRGYPYRSEFDLGGLKLKVRPKKAQVYLDGQLIGNAGRFDGFPGNLWLERGTHELTFFLPGFRTETRSVRVHPGVLVKYHLEMEPGESVPPEELWASKQDKEPVAPVAVSEPGRARLVVEPEDSSVYVDGRFVGTGRELAALRSGLVLEPGSHQVEVVRPGYESAELDLLIKGGEEAEMTVRLEAE
jgi:hypothetical protein